VALGLPAKLQDVAFLLVVFLVTSVALRHYLIALKRRGIVEDITERSLHTIPVPTGGGWVVVGCIVISCLLYAKGLSDRETILLGCILTLAGVSWIDDLKSLSATLRLGVHFACVVAATAMLSPDARILPIDVGFWADRVACVLIWVWLINLNNFMDGIDGMAGTDAIHMFSGYIFLGLAIGMGRNELILSIATIGACLAFLRFNWQPSKIMLGDVGSIPFGFMNGWFLITMAVKGYHAAAVILPLYYLMDTTLTLAIRAARGEQVFRPHREHFYQRAVLGGLTHQAVVLRVTMARGVLLILAVVSLKWPLLALAVAIAVSVHQLLILREHSKGASKKPIQRPKLAGGSEQA